MRTTIRLDDDLLREAKAHAARTDRTLTQVIEDALRAALSRAEALEAEEPIEIPTSPGRLRAGVDLDDTAGLLDLLEREGSEVPGR